MTPIAMTTKSAPSLRQEGACSIEEWQMRVDLAAAYRLCAMFGWDDLVFTHLSARLPGPDNQFLINPFGLLFEEITASSLVLIDVDGHPVRPTIHPVNAAGFTIHSAIHMNRHDAHAVVHLHTGNGLAVSAMADGLLPITQTALGIYHDISYHEFEGIAFNLEERERLVSDLGSKNLMILRNHGTLTLGETVAAAFTRMYFLERACEAQVKALTVGMDQIRPAPASSVDLVAEQTAPHKTASIAHEWVWPALLRKLDRIDPSYKL
jgi:ribulose-5-phosphate 4-epimerase/fuculose-1-phosphate aldolase